MEGRSGRLALWLLLLILAGTTLLGELVLFSVGIGAYALAVPVVTVAAGLTYLAWAAPRGRPTPDEDEPFDDPVVEALTPVTPSESPEGGTGTPTAGEPPATTAPPGGAAP